MDPFIHLPHLKSRVVDPSVSRARVTPEVLASWDRRMIEQGGQPQWRLPDAVREASRQSLLQALPQGAPVWVFAYGSLMWDPGFHFAEVRMASLPGYTRRFNYRVIGGRGTPAVPGLVLSLMPQPDALCHGLAFRIAADQVEPETVLLWRREMIRDGYQPLWLDLQSAQGAVRAIVFAASPGKSMYVHDLTADQTAQRLAIAEGYLGRNRDYLKQLAEQLQALGLEDAYVSDLSARVARL